MYAEKLPAMQSPHLPEQKQSKKDIYTCLYEIEIDDESGFADYLKLIEEGEITFEELQNSNKVIIYLPKLYEWKGEKIVAAKDYQYWLRKNSVITWKENTIEPGTLLTIEGEKGKVEVQVAAIIYSEAKESHGNPYMPLTLIGGEKLGKQLYDAADYACIEVYENPNVNSLQTEKELLEYNEGRSDFMNEKQEREKKFTGFLVQIVIVGIMNMIVITLLIIIKWGIADSRGYIDLRRNQLFYALGMTKRKIKWYYLAREIHAGILCTIVSMVGILCCLFLRDYSRMYIKPDIQPDNFLCLLNTIYRMSFLYYRAWVCLGVGIVYIFLIIAIVMWSLKKNKKLY